MCNQAWLLCGRECEPSRWIAAGQQGQPQGQLTAWDPSARRRGVLAPVAELTTHPKKPQSDETRLIFTKKDMSSLLKYIYCTKK